MALADEYTIGMQWFYSNALGGVQVQIPESQKDRAIEVLLQDYSKSLEEDKGIGQTADGTLPWLWN
ncbi:MAG: hypothetical protein JXA04_07730 [Gammaproteobacteria bacterium]|nr:hypothetical protein [Gammaproteobacteria bacterium]